MRHLVCLWMPVFHNQVKISGLYIPENVCSRRQCGSTIQLPRPDDSLCLLCLLWRLLPPPRRLCDPCCLSVCLSVCLSFCEQNYCKSNEPISLKLGVMIASANRKNWLTLGGDPVPDTDSGSLFHFPHHCGTGDFRRSLSISHTATGRLSRHSVQWLKPTLPRSAYLRSCVSVMPGAHATLTLWLQRPL